MIGASIATIVGDVMKPSIRLIATFGLAIVAFALLAFIGSHSFLMTSFAAFMIFEFCVGLYFPSIGVLKSDLVPERVRGTMYNIYRVPLNAVVVGLLLSHISMVQCFMLCAALVAVALLSVMSIRSQAKLGEAAPLTPKPTKQV